MRNGCADPRCICCHRRNYDNDLVYVGPIHWWHARRWLASWLRRWSL